MTKVRSFGTEGRSGDPLNEIPLQHNTFPLIVFKGSDVKDLKVEDSPAVTHVSITDLE
jgi:protein LSM14